MAAAPRLDAPPPLRWDMEFARRPTPEALDRAAALIAARP
jgi:hypothetical protein